MVVRTDCNLASMRVAESIVVDCLADDIDETKNERDKAPAHRLRKDFKYTQCELWSLMWKKYTIEIE